MRYRRARYHHVLRHIIHRLKPSVLTAHEIWALVNLPQHIRVLCGSQAHAWDSALRVECPELERERVRICLSFAGHVEPALDGRVGEVDPRAGQGGVSDALEARAGGGGVGGEDAGSLHLERAGALGGARRGACEGAWCGHVVCSGSEIRYYSLVIISLLLVPVLEVLIAV